MADLDKSLKLWKKKTLQLVFFSILFTLLYVFFSLTRAVHEIFVCFFIAILLYYLLRKPVNFFARYIKSHVLSVLIILLAGFLLLTLIGMYATPIIAAELKELKLALPAIVMNLEHALLKVNHYLAQYQIQLPIQNFGRQEILNTVLPALSKLKVSDFGTFFTSILLSSVSVLLYGVLSVILAVYLLVDGTRVWDLLVMAFSKKWQYHLNEIKLRVHSSLSAFIVGQFQIAVMTSTVMLITYLSLGVPYAVLLAMVQMLEIMPVIGTWLAIVPCLLVILFTSGLTPFFVALAIYLIYSQLVRDNFITPRVLGDALGMHPLGIILTLAVGAKLAGAVGVVLSLPLLAVASAALNYFIELSHLQASRKL